MPMLPQTPFLRFALAADAAASAAQKLILARMDEKRAGNLIADSIKDLSTKLN